jgi:hypothetical protein
MGEPDVDQHVPHDGRVRYCGGDLDECFAFSIARSLYGRTKVPESSRQ